MLKKYGKFYFFSFEKLKNISSLISDLKKLADNYKKNTSFFLMLSGGSIDETKKMLALFSEQNIPVFGSFFPLLIVDGKVKKKGLLIRPVESLVPPLLIKNLASKSILIQPQYMKILKKANIFSAMVIIDGLSPGSDYLVNLLFESFGDSCAVFGGGGGHFNFEDLPCIFDNTGIYNNAALICFFPLKARTGVSHGFKKRVSPLVATAIEDDNILVDINWEPAWDIYKKYVEQLSNTKLDIPLNQAHLHPLCKIYPLGIHRDDTENILREIIRVNEDKSIKLGGPILEDSVLNIMEGNCSDLLLAAERAAERSIPPNISSKNIEDTILFDCVTRNEAMEESFIKELNQIKNKLKLSGLDIPMNGALTVGEIASTGRSGSADIYNKTLIIANLYTP